MRGADRSPAGWIGVSASLALLLPAGALACGDGGGSAAPGEDVPPAAMDTMTVEVRSADTVLAGMARELLPEAARISGLPPRGRVHLARRTRQELAGYLESQLDEQLPEDRAERLASAYRRLGLLPDTLRLRPFLRKLYLEQVAGYYDPAADTLFVMEGAPEERLRTVLVHELVHALQDQRVDLDSLTDALDGENDRSTALQAAVEGQATFAMTEWQLGQVSGKPVDLTAVPGVLERMQEGAAAGGAAMPVFQSAPRILRETLTFPYLDGMGFVLQLWRSRPDRPSPFGDLLPLSTEQVLHPERLAGEGADRPTGVRVDGPPEGWSERYDDSLGELELGILLTEHLGEPERARRLAAGWDGDLLLLARDGEGREGLAWISVWDSAAEADSAAAGLEEAMASRYGDGAGRQVEVRRENLAGRPGVVMLDLPAGAAAAPWRELSGRVGLHEIAR